MLPWRPIPCFLFLAFEVTKVPFPIIHGFGEDMIVAVEVGGELLKLSLAQDDGRDGRPLGASVVYVEGASLVRPRHYRFTKP
jgi:hypothetical protein